jgi:hypothetical protein
MLTGWEKFFWVFFGEKKSGAGGRRSFIDERH